MHKFFKKTKRTIELGFFFILYCNSLRTLKKKRRSKNQLRAYHLDFYSKIEYEVVVKT